MKESFRDDYTPWKANVRNFKSTRRVEDVVELKNDDSNDVCCSMQMNMHIG